MENKKIAVFAYNHPESTLPLVKHLAKKGCCVDYYFVTRFGNHCSSAFDFGRKMRLPGLWRNNRKYMKPYYDYMESDRVNIYLVVLPPYPQRYLSWFSRLLFIFMGLWIKYKKYDYINVVGQNPPLLDLIKTLKSVKECVYVSLHEVTPHYSSQSTDYKLIDYLLTNRINIITHSNASKERLLQLDESASNHISVIPFGVFETYTIIDDSQCDLSIEQPYILNYGNLLPYKGLDVFCGAVEILGSELDKIKIVVAGRGDDPCLSKIVNDPRYIVINRYLSNEEIVYLNKKAYCVVCPYKSASQSGIVSTSFLFGKPIIASNVGGFNEYIVDGENGLLVSPDNQEELAMKMIQLINDSHLYKKLKDGALSFFESDIYSWDNISNMYLALFEDNE